MPAELNWFWEHFDEAGWSIWEILYEKAEGEGQ